MIFTSFTFFWFMVIVFTSYWLVRNHKLQNLLLLIASYAFYGWVHPWFLILLAGSTVFDWALRARDGCAGRSESAPGWS